MDGGEFSDVLLPFPVCLAAHFQATQYEICDTFCLVPIDLDIKLTKPGFMKENLHCLFVAHKNWDEASGTCASPKGWDKRGPNWKARGEEEEQRFKAGVKLGGGWSQGLQLSFLKNKCLWRVGWELKKVGEFFLGFGHQSCLMFSMSWHFIVPCWRDAVVLFSCHPTSCCLLWQL